MHPPKSWTETTEPVSYEQIYKHLERTLEEYVTLIDQAEIDYYQGPSTGLVTTPRTQTTTRPLSMLTLQAWAPLLNELREARSLHDIRNGRAIRELLAEAKTGSLYGSYKDESLVLMKRVLDKTNEQLYSKIPFLTNKIADLMNLMEQYFLSFYDVDHVQDIVQNRRKEKLPDQYLETAHTYEKTRWIHIFEVNKALKILREMPHRVEDAKGIVLSALSKECQELALRCECGSLSYLFALPECFHQARQALVSLRTWLSEDTNYNDFIETSLKILEEKYVDARKAFEISRSQLSQIEHRAEFQRLQLQKLEEENAVNEKKCEDFETRLNLKEREYTSRRITNEVYEEQLNRLQTQSVADKSKSVENHLSIERFQLDLKKLSREVPKLKAQVDAIQTRLDYFQQRQEELIKIRQENKRLEKEVQLALEEKILKENYLNRIQNCRDIIKKIYKCRTAEDLPQKIFYDLPIKTNHTVDNENDELARATRLISKYIGRDWNRLYWQLPFYPTRGQEEVAKDIKTIDEKYQRGNVFQDQAIEILNKWRRFHTRAKVDDLTHALQRIRRFDIIHIIERRIWRPRRLLNMDQEDIDPRKKEIDDLDRKLSRLFGKMRSGAITSRDTYVYSTMGLDPLRPVTKSARTRRPSRQQSSRSISINLTKSFCG